MSQENVETFRRADEALKRGDRAAFCECFDPDAVLVPLREWPENAPVRGPEAIWDAYASFTEAWEAGPFEVGEIIEVGPDKLVANSQRRTRGRASGVELVFSYWLVSTYRNGKVIRSEWFADRAEALEAAGLLE
jgi:ketosteroid isomerase-like protein